MGQVTIDIPANVIGDALAKTSDPFNYDKIIRHQSVDWPAFHATEAVTALTKDVHIVRGASGTLLGVEAAIDVVATGGDRTITVDLHKSTGGGGFATVLSSTIGFNSGSSVRTAVAGVLSATSLVDGDILRVVVSVAGAAGAQAQGLIVSVHFAEKFA